MAKSSKHKKSSGIPTVQPDGPAARPDNIIAKPSSLVDTGAHAQEAASSTPDQRFESFYLQRVTAEFADDIDKIRTASDFKDSSVPILIDALKQGARSYSKADQQKMMKGDVEG